MAMLSPKFDDLTIGHDFLFKKVMRNPRICKHLLEEVLQAPIAEISYPEIEKTIDVFYDSRGVRLDVIVADEKHTHYNLEMQVKNTTNPKTGQHVLPKRTRYYQAMLDVDALQKGQNFDLLPATYIIFICAFDFFGEGNYIYTFKKRCLERPELEFPDETTIILLNTTGTHGSISPDIKSFFEYVNQHTVTSDFTKEIDKEIFHIKSDQKARLEYMSLETYVQDNRYEAYAEGEAKGLAKGLAEGVAQGLAEGDANEKFATVKRMLNLGKSLEDIMLITDLPMSKIQELQAEMQAV